MPHLEMLGIADCGSLHLRRVLQHKAELVIGDVPSVRIAIPLAAMLLGF